MNEGMTLPAAIKAALPRELAEASAGGSLLSDGASYLGSIVPEALWEALRGSLRGAAALMLLGVISGAATVQAGKDNDAGQFVPVCAVLGAAVLSASDMETLVGLGARTVEELNTLTGLMLPAVASAMAAGGFAATAGVWQVTALMAADALTTLIRTVLLPLVYCALALSAADAALPEGRLRPIAEALQKGTGWVLCVLLTAFSAYLSLTGVLTGSADRTALKMTKLAAGAVPVVGGVLSDAAESVLAGASALRGTLGTLGIFAVLAASLAPLVRMLVQYILCSLAAFVCAATGPEALGKFVQSLASSCALVLAMTAACSLLLTVSFLVAASMAVAA